MRVTLPDMTFPTVAGGENPRKFGVFARICLRLFLGLAFAGAFFCPLVRFFGAIRFAIDVNNVGVMNDAINHGDDTGGAGEDLAPFGEGTVRREDEALLFVATVDQLEQEIGVPIAIGKLPDFVDAQ